MKINAEVVNRGPLTAQEAVVLKHLCEGYMRKEIASRVFRSYGCVSKQIESIAEKLGAHSAAEIVAVAVAEGLVEITRKPSETHLAIGKFMLMAFLIAPQHIDHRQPPRNFRLRHHIARISTHIPGGRSWT
jgi:DNA-binding CsgD family transcriptional regulator